MSEGGVALAAIGLAGAICTGFFAMVAKMNTTIQAQNKIHSKISDGLNRLAEAHETGNKESAERNGHLGELIVEQGKQTQVIADKAVTAIIEGTQNVTEQKVENQTVKKKD